MMMERNFIHKFVVVKKREKERAIKGWEREREEGRWEMIFFYFFLRGIIRELSNCN